MANFILVSGAWHAGWCWERVVPLLEADGHRVLAPDLLGTGSDRTPLSSVTLSKWANQIADLISGELEPVILVGHSRGGIVISQAAERVSNRIQSLVYVAAGLVPDGESLGSITTRLVPDFGIDMVTMHPDGTFTVTPEALGSRLYQKTDAEWVRRAEARLRPDPSGILMEPLHLSAERFGSIPRAYIETAEDQTLPIELQRLMRKDMPCEPVITLQSDHCPFYSDPEALTGALLSIARSAVAKRTGPLKLPRGLYAGSFDDEHQEC